MAAGGPRRCAERPWDRWVAALGRDRPRRDEPLAEEAPPPPRLRRAHMPLHGRLPAAPPLLALCALCGAAIALCAARAHLVERHAAPPLPPPPSTPPRHKRRARPSQPAEQPQHQPGATLADPAAASSPAGASEASPPAAPAPPPAPLGERPEPADGPKPDAARRAEPLAEESPAPGPRAPTPPPVAPAPPPPVARPPAEPEAAPAAPSRSKPKPGKPPSSKPKYAVREYDPNKHCGVVAGDPSKPCTRSLTCKSHALSLRRLVGGRVKPFDTLLKEHRAAKQGAPSAAPLGPAVDGAAAPPPPEVRPAVLAPELRSPVPASTPTDAPPPPFAAPSPDREPPRSGYYAPPLPAGGDPVAVAEEADLVPLLPRDVVECLGGQIPVAEPPPPPPERPRLPEYRPADVHWYTESPRPLATCTFSACQMGGALFLNRRLATVRSDFKSTVSRSERKTDSDGYYDFAQSSLPSMSKAMQAGGAAKYSSPKLRKLIVTYPSLAGAGGGGDRNLYYGDGGRNGHLYVGKRPFLSEFEDETKCMRTSGPGVDSARSDLKVTKHSNPSDMLELNFMFDPMMADEKS